MMAGVQVIDGQVVFSPTDLVGFLECEHLAMLDYRAVTVEGATLRPAADADPGLALLQKLGLDHEAAYLESLRSGGAEVVEIDDSDLHAAVEATVGAMRCGTEVVFQAAMLTGRWRGHADFLCRVETPSDLGEWSYEPYDTKLARRSKVGAVVQLAVYALQIAEIQGRAPEHVHIVLGDGYIESFATSEVAPYVRRARRRLVDHVEAGAPTRAERCGHCQHCAWYEHCEQEWVERDDLRLVARLGRPQADRLREVGIVTAAELATASEDDRPPRMGEAAFDSARRQARLQVEARSGPDVVEILDPADNVGGGFALLPEPDETDLFFDLEGDPHHQPRGLEYLWGVTDTDDRYRSWWGHDHADERAAFEAVVDYFGAHCDAHPEAHIYHYANYEIAVLKRLSALHTSREAELDRLLRERRFVDLYAVVRGAVATSRPGYSIKELENFYRPARGTGVVSGLESVVEYHRWMAEGDQAILDDIEAYNTDDCVSTRQLRDWLEEHRRSAIETHGEIPRPSAATFDAEDRASSSKAAEAVESLYRELVGDCPDSLSESERLMAGLVGFHRREHRAAWWQHFDRLAMTMEQLHENTESIAGLAPIGEVGTIAKSSVWRYRFDPDQPYKLRVGQEALQPLGGDESRSAGTIVAIDPRAGAVDIKRGRASVEAGHPEALVPAGPPGIDGLEEAVAAVAREETDRRAIDALIERRPPSLLVGVDLVVANESSGERLVRLGRGLDAGTLAVQGPPGTGKTRGVARLIVDLVSDGKRVGVTANSHAVVLNLLEAVCGASGTLNPTEVVKVGGDGFDLGTHISGSKEAAERWTGGEGSVIGGTAWLFCRDDMRDSVDVLVIEEAGQFSLANAVAVSPAATSLVLIGDPAQLDQPMQAVHPPGSSASALGHFQGDDATLPPERGVFLDTTFRMHSSICSFVSRLSYRGGLTSDQITDARSIEGIEAGLRWMPVEHSGNASASPEEASVVAELVEDLLGRRFVDGPSSAPIGTDDILVITPFNAQIRELENVLTEGVAVGTVDRFQGREAPAVIYSMAASTADDAPRGPGFLFHRNRLNVALSRAQCLAVVVASPALLDAGCRTPEQLIAASSLCDLVESAG